MKANVLPVLFIILAAAIGCQKPCTKTTIKKGYFGDTTFVERTYANCNDTLTYYEKQMRSDSTVVSEGEVVNGKKEGEWSMQRWGKEIITFSHGVEVNIKEFDKNGILSLERTLGTDSVYRQRQFDGQGRLMLEEFVNIEGYLTGHGISYDSLGRKDSEGENIAEECLLDTMYVESPEPPYDLQMTLVAENGGKHGPWVFYNAEGKATDTTIFDHGVATWSGDLTGKWNLDSLSTTDTASIGLALFAFALNGLKGFEFKNDGSVSSFDEKGKSHEQGSYRWSRDRTYLFLSDQGEDEDAIRIAKLTPTELQFVADGMTYYLVR